MDQWFSRCLWRCREPADICCLIKWKFQDVLRTSISLILSISHSQIVAWIAFYSKIVWEIQTKTFKVKEVVLIIDNCPPNPIIDNLSHAKLVFLSLCTTSVSQLWINNTYKEELLLYWIQYKHLLKYRVGCFWSFSYDYTIN